MHNTLRDGADLELAFKLQMRRFAPTPSQVRDRHALGVPREPDNVASKGVRAKSRKWLHSALSAVVRRLEPKLHPIALRLRRFLTASVQEDLQVVKARLQSDIRTQVAELAARLDRRVLVYGEPEEVLVRSDVGYVLCPRQDYALLVRLLEGTSEHGTHLLLQRLLKPGDVFIDVGASVGLHTLAAARAMQGSGHIVALEACGPTKRLLEKTVALNGFAGIVDIYQAAVSSLAGRQKLLAEAPIDQQQPSSWTVPPETHRAPTGVHCVTLDEIMAANPAVNLIRIDVQGAELDVLDGSRSLLGQNDEIALVVKFGPAHIRRTGHTTEDWLSGFESFGFVHRVIDDETGMPDSRSAEQLDGVDSVNLLFARPDAAVWRKAEIWR